MSSPGVLRTFVKHMFGRYLLVTNTLTSGSLMALGDCTLQTIEGINDENHSYDWKRTGRLSIIGLVLGPCNHFFYGFLDKRLPGTEAISIGKKILLDQFISSPVFTFSFFTGSGLLEGKDLSAALDEFKNKFWAVYKMDWTVWPAAQAVNFYFLPPQFRVIYVCSITLCWDTFLSYMKHKDVAKCQDCHGAATDQKLETS